MSVVQRGKSALLVARDVLKAPISYENAKTVLFYYFVLRHALKVHRHLRARGITESAREIYRWISQVCATPLGRSDPKLIPWLLANRLLDPSNPKDARESQL